MTPDVVRFRLMGKEFRRSITEINLAFDFIDVPYSQSSEYMTRACKFTELFFSRNTDYWKDLSVDTQFYDPSQSKA